MGSARDVAAALRRGIWPSEDAFERLLPADLRLASTRHWTPMPVIERVAGWMGELGITSIVDIGSGVGKFCILTALATDCRVVGIEHRPRLVRAARTLARSFGVDHRIDFVDSSLGDGELATAEAYYVYNSFAENLFDRDKRIDDDVELNKRRYDRDVARMEDMFDRAPAGTYAILYNGFGGRLPSAYETVRVDRKNPSLLAVWQNKRASRAQ